MTVADYGPLDAALERLGDCGPDLANGLTNHAPMAAEALCALGRPEAVDGFVERYRTGTLPWPAGRDAIAVGAWTHALGRPERAGDWRALFASELEREAWPRVLDRWVGRLAPGICAAACHGVIRVGHAARSLRVAETPPRRRELGDALASWAMAYQELPTRPCGADGDAAATGLEPDDAIARVPIVPTERRRFTGTIVSSLEGLSDAPGFESVIDLLDTSPGPGRLVPALGELFARVYLGSAHDVLTSIVFVHGITAVHALGNLAPHLRDETARRALAFTWQAACGLHAAFGRGVAAPTPDEPGPLRVPALVDRAVAHGDEHAIKLTEACRALEARRPSAAFGSAVEHALATLPPAR